MSKSLRIVICGLLIVGLAAPAFADGQRSKRGHASFTSSVCAGGAHMADKTAGLFTGCLHRTFSFFNPCLDLVKGCTSIVLAPVEKPFDYMENALACRWCSAKAPKVPAAKKP
jgi:hypothetical protein